MARGDQSNSSVTLGPRDSLIGTLTIEGDLTVQGKAEGELHVSGDVSVDDGANVRAQIEGNNVTVQGSVQGNVSARGRLALSGSDSVQGDVRVAKLSVEDGATLNGNVSMGQPSGHGRGSRNSGQEQQPEGHHENQHVEEPQPEAVG